MKLVSILLRFVFKMVLGEKEDLYLYKRTKYVHGNTSHHPLSTRFSPRQPLFHSNAPLYVQTTHYFYTDTYTHTNIHTYIHFPHIYFSSIAPHLDYLPIYNEVSLRIHRTLLPSYDTRFGERRNPQFLTAHNLRVVRRRCYICAPDHRSRYFTPSIPLLYHLSS
jgi:hypothetical protein